VRWSTILGLFLLFPGLGLLSSSAQVKPAPNFASLSSQANAARDADRLDEALSLYHKALELRPTWAEGWWSVGTIQYDRNAYAEAARAFQRLLALRPQDGTAHAFLGLCKFELGRDDAAFRHIEQSRKIGLSGDPQFQHVVLFHEGVLLQRAGKFERAQEDLQQLCLQGVESNEIFSTLGLVLLRRKDSHPPAASSEEAGMVSGIGRSGCLAGQKKYEDARQILDALVKQHPNYPNIHYALGMFLLEAHDQPAAIDEFKREIENNPEHVPARLRIAAALYKTDSDAGIAYAEQAVKLAPEVPLGHYLLGLLLLDTNHHERSIPELEIARKAFPRDAKLYLALGTAYARVGRTQEAARARATFERLQKEDARASPAGEKSESVPR
jgi:tetratricopeptide (TPR) repeat protein